MGKGRDSGTCDVQEAFRATCYDFGVDNLAPLMGVSKGVLYNKCNHHDGANHKPTLADAVLAQVITKDKRVTQAMAQLMGGVFIDLSGLDGGAGDAAILDLVTAWMKEQGDLFATFQAAYGDGVIDAKEFKSIRKEAFAVLQAIVAFLKRVEAMQS